MQNNEYRLLGIIVFKFLMNAIAISSPIPSGIFVPMFLLGGVIGRFYGILMFKWFAINRVIEFSVVGAACKYYIL